MSGPYTTVEIRQGIFRIDGPVIGEFLVASDDLAGRIVRAVNAAYAAGLAAEGARWSASRQSFVVRLKQELADRDFEPSKLQYAQRTTTDRAWTAEEIEYGILDALVNEGGATAWRGDGSSCAVQLVMHQIALAEARGYAAGREGVRAETLEEAAQLAEGWVNDTRWEANIRLGARYAAAKIRSILAQTDKEQT